MNPNFKILVGAGVGSVIGYFVGAVIVEIIVIKEGQYENFSFDNKEEKLDLGESVMSNEPSSIKGKKDYVQYFKNQKREDLAELARKYNGETSSVDEKDENTVVEETEEEMEEEMEEVTEEAEKDPKIISAGEFANSDGFQVVTLNYYDDDVVVDENDNPINRPEQILGDEALVSFGELSGDEDVVYVRNEKKRAIYEVIRTNKNYSADTTSDRVRLAKEKMKRRKGKAPIDFEEEADYGEDIS